jgi:hypothetical protein
MGLYFEQLTPLVILSQTAEETGKTVAQVEDETNKALENPATTDDTAEQTIIEPKPTEEMEAFSMLNLNNKEYEIYR